MVPEGWTSNSLDSAAKVIDCKHRTPPYVEEGIPVISPGTIKWGEIDIETPSKRVSQVEYESLMDHCVVERGDLVLGRNQSVGVASYIKNPEPFVLGQDTVLVKPVNIDARFLFYSLQSQQTQRKIFKIASGSTFSRINLKDIRKLPVLAPPLPEQTKIAQILSTWDKAIATTEQLLSNSQQQKKALMQQLLTGKKRFPGFEGEWKGVYLADICTINPRKYPRPFDGKVTFVPMDAVTEDAKLVRYETREYSEVEKGFTSFADNDVLIAKITPCFENGKGAFAYDLANGIGFGSTEFHVLRANSNFCPKLIYYLTNSREFRIRGEANMQGSAGQRRVPTDYLRCYKLMIPLLFKEQQKITSVLSTADREIETLQQELDNLKQEKKALMQQLLTGKRRVKIDA